MTIEAMRKRHEHNAKLGTRASVEIFAALRDSTFAEKHPDALIELLFYKNDVARSIEKVLNRSRLK